MALRHFVRFHSLSSVSLLMWGRQAEDKQAVLLSAEKSVWSGVSEESRERE